MGFSPRFSSLWKARSGYQWPTFCNHGHQPRLQEINRNYERETTVTGRQPQLRLLGHGYLMATVTRRRRSQISVTGPVNDQAIGVTSHWQFVGMYGMLGMYCLGKKNISVGERKQIFLDTLWLIMFIYTIFSTTPWSSWDKWGEGLLLCRGHSSSQLYSTQVRPLFCTHYGNQLFRK